VQYMNLLVPEDLDALNELAKLTWAWELRYWTEKGLTHGSFILNALNPIDTTWYNLGGATVHEVINTFLNNINKDSQLLTNPDYP